ncbi:radical SAM protein [Yersinia similis]|uniref:Radical SAM protein n=1 Tax=Yersinia similis TaxID=367190 RepID=A0ABM5Q3B9_9GAMM|nr:anaerobic sulfatase maturase [Yersinia similis]AHK21859.1 radical SAM protein [Yersinia similis]CFQ62491.1 putative sulfatase regulator [Yersinia similis]
MHITAKPTSYQCNLKCDYCFYLSKENIFQHKGWMTEETLETFIERYISVSGHDVYFTWQGGEPTMAGLDFFGKAIQYQNRYKGTKKIHNALQTNGILLDDAWCLFLRENHFLVGVSIDGPKELHDRYRVTRSGKGSFDKVMAGIEQLKKYQVEFNTLTVINRINVKYPLEVYRTLKSIGAKHIQFIELLETTEPNIDFSNQKSTFELIEFTVPAVDYGHFMAEVFKEWVRHDVGTLFIRQFESFVSRFIGNGHTSCVFQKSCKNNFVMESNGDIYECDHFVYPEYKIGNIYHDKLDSLASDKLSAQKEVLSESCRKCMYKTICYGGCPKHRIDQDSDGMKSYFCAGYKILFSIMVPYMNALAELEKNGIPLNKIMSIVDDIECGIKSQQQH